MIYLCAAYLAIWLLVFAYLFFLRGKQKELQQRIARLQGPSDAQAGR